jgi:opacity protein-like surface antigen
MLTMKVTYWIAAIALMMAGSVPAQAQSRAMGSFGGYFTPFVGVTTGGEVSEPRVTFGASVAVHEQNGWGAELDFGYAGEVEAGALVLDATTYMVNAAWVRPVGMIRPFAMAGGGILQLEGCGFCGHAGRTFDLGWTVGAGVLARANDFIGVRGDARYFFASADHVDLQRPDNFSFWRLSAGVTLMWVMLP